MALTANLPAPRPQPTRGAPPGCPYSPPAAARARAECGRTFLGANNTARARHIVKSGARVPTLLYCLWRALTPSNLLYLDRHRGLGRRWRRRRRWLLLLAVAAPD